MPFCEKGIFLLDEITLAKLYLSHVFTKSFQAEASMGEFIFEKF